MTISSETHAYTRKNLSRCKGNTTFCIQIMKGNSFNIILKVGEKKVVNKSYFSLKDQIASLIGISSKSYI